MSRAMSGAGAVAPSGKKDLGGKENDECKDNDNDNDKDRGFVAYKLWESGNIKTHIKAYR